MRFERRWVRSGATERSVNTSKEGPGADARRAPGVRAVADQRIATGRSYGMKSSFWPPTLASAIAPPFTCVKTLTPFT